MVCEKSWRDVLEPARSLGLTIHQNIPQIPRNQEAAEELLRERTYMGKERLGGAFVVQ